MSDDLKNLFQKLEKAKKESVKEEQENLNKTASSLKTTVGVIKQNEISNLFEGLEQASVEADIEIKRKLELNEKEKEKLNDFSALMEKVGSLSENTQEENVSQITEVVTEFVEPEIVEEEIVEEDKPKPTTIIDEIVSNLDDMGQKTEVKEQLDEIQSLRKEFEQYKKTLQNQVTKGLATSSGGGEVRLEFLDDVQRSTAKVNGKFLKYDSTAGLFVGSDVTATAETNTEEVQDIVGAMFSSNTETNITATYQDGDGTIDLVVGDTTGNAATATALETARTIGGVSFDGTANINLPGVNTSGTQDSTGNAATATTLETARTIGGVSFNGSANINLPGVNTSGTQDTSGNAATATALESARTIHGVSFDGTGNIDLSEVIQDTVGAMFSSNTETNISATYQDGDGTIDLVVGDTSGNSATATALETARTIHGVSFDGTANIDLSEVVQDTVGAMFSSNTETGITVTYQDGDGTIDLVVGTLNQDTTGNAATATALETARTIHGVSFDGTGNIDLSEVIQDTVGAMFSSNTETGITATYQDADGTVDLVIATLNQDTTGNAATATTLETARTIGGVSFNGSANINLPGVNTSGTQDTSGNADTATALATARAINGVDFDGTGAITVTAAAGTLSGNTLKSTVTASSLTSVGTLTSLVIADAGNIGSASDTDAISIGSDGDVTLTQDLELQHDGAILSFGANDEVTLTHVHNTGLTLTHTATGDNTPIVLRLKSEENAIVENEVIASIEMAAGDSDGSDGATVAAGIHAIAEDTFSSTANATKLVFTTGVSETAAASATAKMTLSSAGLLTIADDFLMKDGGTIGVASATSAITIASTGIVTFVDDIKIKDGGTIGTATNPAALTLGAAGKLTVALKTQSTGFIVADDGYIGSVSDTDLLQFSSTGQSFFQSDDVGWLPVNIRRAISTANAGTGLSFQLGDSASATAGHIYGEIRAHIEDNTNGAEDGYLVLRTSLSGTSAEKVRVASNGLVTFQGNLVLQDDGTIGCASDTDLVTIGDGVVTVAGNVTLSGATNTVTAQNTPKWNSTAQSTNFTAAVQNQYFIDTSGGAFTMTLPSTANIGDEIRVVDGVGSFDTNNLTIARNGHKIQRDASDLTITTEGAAFALVYYNSTNGWLLKDR